MTPIPKFNDIVAVFDFYGLLSDYVFYTALVMAAMIAIGMSLMALRVVMVFVVRVFSSGPVKAALVARRVRKTVDT